MDCIVLFSVWLSLKGLVFTCLQIMRLRRIERGALTLASAEVKFQIDTETHDPLDIGMF
jgi:exoribonuclease R